MTLQVPASRVRPLNQLSLRDDGEYVLYWMTSFRRPTWNFSLQRAAEWATRLGKPLVILEALRTGYRWASDRLHQFVIQGMADNKQHFASYPVTYYPFIETRRNEGAGLVEALAQRAAVVLVDDFPSFFLPTMLRVITPKIKTRFEAIDSNGLLPLSAADKTYDRAYTFRRFLQKAVPSHLEQFPAADPLESLVLPRLTQLPGDIATRWPMTADLARASHPDFLATLPIDHSVPVVTEMRGGFQSAKKAMDYFLAKKFSDYGTLRNEPDEMAVSGLSPYLHFGHISAHEVVSAVFQREKWHLGRLAKKPNGSRNGWWNMSETAEAFIDELVTWREVGFNMSSRESNYDRYESLPDWAQTTLAEHEVDRRPYVYSLDELEASATHDKIWNAAQRELVQTGRIHNYLRMLWGKKILEWSPNAPTALDYMVELNNKWALDGRNPNSYSGIFWVLGRYDRPWGPERDIFGKIRYMSSDNTLRKIALAQYLRRFGDD